MDAVVGKTGSFEAITGEQQDITMDGTTGAAAVPDTVQLGILWVGGVFEGGLDRSALSLWMGALILERLGDSINSDLVVLDSDDEGRNDGR